MKSKWFFLFFARSFLFHFHYMFCVLFVVASGARNVYKQQSSFCVYMVCSMYSEAATVKNSISRTCMCALQAILMCL